MPPFLKFCLILALGSPLWSLDRLTFDDGQVLTVKILGQSDEGYLYADDKGATNSALKADLKGVEFNVGEDKFLAAAIEETDPTRQVLFLEKSIKRYPKDRANYIYYVRVLLREMQTVKAGEILTNRDLENPGFDLLRIWWILKTKDGDAALSALRNLSRRKWNEQQNMQADLLEGFSLVDSGRWAQGASFLDGVERKWGIPLWSAHTALMAYEDYPHFRRSLNSVIYLSKSSYRSKAAQDSLRPNVTRYWRRLGEIPPGTPMVETMVIHQRSHLSTLQDVLAIAGSALVGIGAAHGAMAADQYQDWLTAKTWYESASRNWELSSFSTGNNGGTYNGNGGGKQEYERILSFENTFTAYKYYESWSAQMNSLVGPSLGFTAWGVAIDWISVGDPFRWFERTPAPRAPMHLRFVVDRRGENAMKITSGLASVSLAAAGVTFGIYSQYWNEVARLRADAYRNNRTVEYFDFMADQMKAAQYRADAYRITSISAAAAAILCGAVYFLDPFKKMPAASVLLPKIEADGVGLVWMGTF